MLDAMSLLAPPPAESTEERIVAAPLLDPPSLEAARVPRVFAEAWEVGYANHEVPRVSILVLCTHLSRGTLVVISRVLRSAH